MKDHLADLSGNPEIRSPGKVRQESAMICCLLVVDVIMNEGKMVDASFTIAPRQRNTRAENKLIKEGKGDELWNDKPNKKRHKDIDARWTKKNNETFYGYKNHAKADTKSKFIDTYKVTDASVHDSQPLEDLLIINPKRRKVGFLRR